ncbi:MAG: hypothetical protein ACRDYC_07235, partial [Acidimicrobiales bacterium]
MASFATGSSPTLNFHHYGGSTAALASSTSGLLAHLPLGIRPQGPVTRETAPKTAIDFADSLWFWLETAEGIRSPPTLFDAWQRYVRQTVQYANDYGLACSRAYHSSCMEAAERGWWHPLSNGPAYTQAYSQHIAPAAAKPAGRAWSRQAPAKAVKPAAGGAKRKALPYTPDAPATRSRRQTCSVHPTANHT